MSGLAVLAVLGYASSQFAGHVTGTAVTRPAVTGSAVTRSAAPARQAASSAPSARTTAVPTAPAASVPAVPTATAPPSPRVLLPVSAVAFGPDGTADGDDPQNAADVLTDPAGGGWLTRWYATPVFGGLQTGTGLLLDMGRTVTITAVRLKLGSQPGADLQVRLGAVPSLAALPVVSTARATSDLLSVPLARPARARYVLLWFTSLPPDGAGTYRLLVHKVTVDGRP